MSKKNGSVAYSRIHDASSDTTYSIDMEIQGWHDGIKKKPMHPKADYYYRKGYVNAQRGKSLTPYQLKYLMR